MEWFELPETPPAYCGPVRVERRSAPAGAGHVGSVVDSPFGVRAMLGRVVGPDRPALASEVLRGFRELALHEISLAGLAFRVDDYLSTRTDDHAKVILAQFRPEHHDAELIACGHEPPLMVHPARPADPCDVPVLLPLGVQCLTADWYASSWITFPPGAALLLSTASHPRTARPYPLADRASRMRSPDPVILLDRLQADLRRHPTAGKDTTTLLYLRPEKAGPPPGLHWGDQTIPLLKGQRPL